MLFTHFGISGSAALPCSRFINQELTRNGNQPVTVALDVFPTKSFEEVLKNVDYLIEEQPNKVAKNAFLSLIPERLL
ncbi:aminoacetone oxidase family FAD-binding enzyme, partial [Enterococcus faecalis]